MNRTAATSVFANSNPKVFKRLLDSLTTSVLVLDQSLRVQYMNLAAESLLAISGRQLHQVYIGDIFINAAQDTEEIKAALQDQHSFTKRKTQLTLMNGRSLQVDY